MSNRENEAVGAGRPAQSVGEDILRRRENADAGLGVSRNGRANCCRGGCDEKHDVWGDSGVPAGMRRCRSSAEDGAAAGDSVSVGAELFKLPQNIYFGEASGVAVNSKGHIFVFSRGNTTGPAYGAAAAQLLEFDANGNYVREIGHNLYAWSYAHTVKVDAHDDIWATDKGSDMVVEFNPEGRVIMVLGRKQEASDEHTGPLHHPNPPLPPVDGLFRQVTDVAWDAEGNTYVSDGYINSRIAKYDKYGNWVKSWGTPGDGPGQFNTPHSIAVDARGEVYVADRGNRRIQVFDGDGNFLRQITIDVPAPPDARTLIGPKPTTTKGTMASGAPWAICITPGPHQYLYSADAYPGRIYKLTLDGNGNCPGDS